MGTKQPSTTKAPAAPMGRSLALSNDCCAASNAAAMLQRARSGLTGRTCCKGAIHCIDANILSGLSDLASIPLPPINHIPPPPILKPLQIFPPPGLNLRSRPPILDGLQRPR